MNYIAQYRGCLYQYAMRTRFKHGKDTTPGIAMKKSIGKFIPVFLRDDTNESKIIQLQKLLRRQKIDLKQKNGYIYFLDETTVPYNHHMTIDNMPIDYNLVVNSSLKEIKARQKKGNSIGIRNITIITIIEGFIDRIIEKDNGQCKKQCDWIASIKERPAESIEEALQRILFINQLMWQTDHLLNGLGRLDKVLERFANEDNKDPILRFLKTLHYYYEYKSNAILGDTGQVIVLGGIEPDGSYYNNSITEMFIQCLTEMKVPDPKVLLRVSNRMPDCLLKLAVDCISTGCGSPLLSNDDCVIPAIESFGYKHEDACNYGVSACWEPLSIGNSLEQNNLFDIEFGKVFSDTYNDEDFVKCKDIDEIIKLYILHLEKHLEALCDNLGKVVLEKDPLNSLFSNSCYVNDKDISEGGSTYNNYGLLSVGLSSAVNSIINIKEYVFDEKKYTLNMIVSCLKDNYDNYPEIKGIFSKNENGFGSNCEYAIYLTSLIMQSTEKKLMSYENKFKGHVKFGLSSPAYVNSGSNTPATGDGRLAGDPFPTHISKESRDALLDVTQFASSLDYRGIKSNGNVVDIIIQSNIIQDNEEKFLQYIKTCIKIGVYQMQINVISYSDLIDAKQHPEKYPNLIVRVWGFSAYFIDLPKEYQNILIERAKKNEGIV